MIMEGCQGKPRTPTISEKICPNCGNPIEIFSTDTQVACDKCGFVVYNDTLSCVQWCNQGEPLGETAPTPYKTNRTRTATGRPGFAQRSTFSNLRTELRSTAQVSSANTATPPRSMGHCRSWSRSA